MCWISKLLVKIKIPLALLILLLSFLLLFQPSPGRAADQEYVWVLVSTVTNPFNERTSFAGGTGDPMYFGEDRFQGKSLDYTVSDGFFSVHAVDVDHGITYSDTTVSVSFDSPPDRLEPGQEITLSAAASHGGTVNEGGSGLGLIFQYSYLDRALEPTLNYRPYNPSWQGSATQEWIFSAPTAASPDSEFELWAGLWNSPPCAVVWTYRAQPAGSQDTAGEIEEIQEPEDQPEAGVVDSSGEDDFIEEESSGINPLLPVAGIGAASAAAAAAAGGAAAAVASRTGKGRRKKADDEREQKRKDPCAQELDRFQAASAQARVLHDGIQTLRSYLAYLDTMYENVRQAAYWNSAVDLGLLGASIFSGPLAAALPGRAVVAQGLAQAMGESALKSLGAEMVKNVTNGMLEQGISWESLAKAPYGGAEGAVLQELIKDLLTQRYQTSLIQRGTPKALHKSLVKGYSKQVASHLASAASQLISLGKIGSGAYTAANKLEFIREELSEIRKSLFEMELQYDDLLTEMRISRSVYQKCRQTWPL